MQGNLSVLQHARKLSHLYIRRCFSEVSKFNEQAKIWWSRHGPVGPLLRFNPARIAVIRAAVERFLPEQIQTAHRPLSNVRFLDVGCGGGILCEPLGRLGAQVLGIDEAEESIKVAQKHAALDLSLADVIEYRNCSLVNLLQDQLSFDCVTCLEVLEHVDCPQEFLKGLTKAVRPGGLLFLSTINRSLISYLGAIVMAENVLQLVPRGTHHWQRFIRPEEVAGCLPKEMTILSSVGITFNPFSGRVRYTIDLNTNYLMVLKKHSEQSSEDFQNKQKESL
eukprot:jgi/Galph1/4495/GphlegSOOS_G3177.1